MSSGQGSGLPDYSGGYDDHARGGTGRHHDPSAQFDSAPFDDPYAQRQDPYGQRDDPYALHVDPYSSGPGPLTADGFAPVFGDASQAPPTGYAGPAHPSTSPLYGSSVPLPPTSSSAVTGFVLGLAGLFVCGGLTAPIGIVFSALGLRDTGDMASPPKSGRSLAIAGLVTSLIGLVPLLVMVLWVVLMVVGAGLSAGA